LICFGYHSKRNNVVHKIPTTGINIVMHPPRKF
jgi:gamma-glutamyl:cysteine ligase YbdK (ATP-grasp superfamily)